MSKPFDIYDYVHNNKITLKVQAERKATNVSKGYNDIRKTNLNEVKIVNGKFSLKESLAGDKRPLSNEVKKHFLEIISTYATFQEQMKRASDLTEVANTLGGIVEAAKELTLRETADWFDGVTVKRNMSELDKMDKSFQKFAVEARAMDERLHSLYEDMGHILSRYYEIADIQPDVMKERLGLKTAIKEGIWPKSKLASPFQMQLSLELKKRFKGIFYSVGYDLYHNNKKVLTIDGDDDSINSVIAKLKSKIG
jgi:hypothetical protein